MAPSRNLLISGNGMLTHEPQRGAMRMDSTDQGADRKKCGGRDTNEENNNNVRKACDERFPRRIKRTEEKEEAGQKRRVHHEHEME